MSLPAPEEFKTILEQLLPGVTITPEGGYLVIEPKHLTTVARCLKDTERFRMEYVANLTAIDYPNDPASAGSGQASGTGRIEMVYHLYSMTHRQGPVALKVKLPRNNPVVDSLSPLWRGAEFQEREVYDLYGVVFTNHPDLRRILMWEGFNGHPMRKDYVPEDQDAPL